MPSGVSALTVLVEDAFCLDDADGVSVDGALLEPSKSIGATADPAGAAAVVSLDDAADD